MAWKPAEAVLFFCSRDIGGQAYKTAGGLNPTELEAVTAALEQHAKPIYEEDLARAVSLSERKLANIIHKLEEADCVSRLDSGAIKIARGLCAAEMAAKIVKLQQAFNDLRKARLEQMRAYSEGRACRREVLLRHFGEDYNGPCQNCDRCNACGVAAA